MPTEVVMDLPQWAAHAPVNIAVRTVTPNFTLAHCSGHRGGNPPHTVEARASGRRRPLINVRGAWEEIRTPDLRITNALLYRLSYPGVRSKTTRFALIDQLRAMSKIRQ